MATVLGTVVMMMTGAVLIRVLLLRTDTMTKAPLIRKTFNWVCLTNSDVQSIIIKAGRNMAASSHIWDWS